MLLSVRPLRLPLLLLLGALVSAGVGHPQPDPAGELRARGLEALEAGEYSAARKLFKEAHLAARERGDEKTAAKAVFHLAVIEQLVAETALNDPFFRDAGLKRSLEIYQQVLEMNPRSAASHQNMARIYLDLKEPGPARESFAKAAEVATRNKPFYLRQYADFLLESGDEIAAAEQYRRLALLQPEDVDLHHIVLELYAAQGAAGASLLLEYLWGLVEEGEVLKAEDAALSFLEGPAKAYTKRQQDGLLAVVAASLSRQSRGPAAIADSATGERLGKLALHQTVGTGARELLKLYRTPGDYAEGFPWWSVRGQSWEEPEAGIWPRDAFRDAMRRVGRWYEHRENFEVAEECYRTAATLSSEEPDPDGYRDLAKLYLSRGEIERLEELDREFSARVYSGKNEAYRRGQLEKIYEYHISLGQVWGYLAKEGRYGWGDVYDSRTPLFQLQRAIEIGKDLDERARESGVRPDPDSPIHLDAAVVELYALGLQETSAEGRARQVRIEAAERFKAAGDDATARRLVAPIRSERLEGIQLQRYRSVIEKEPG